MRFGIDASRAARDQRTGTENYSLHIIRALLHGDRDNQYTLYCNRAPAADVFGPAANATVRPLPSPYLWTHGRLSWEMLRRPPDVLFVPAHVVPLYCPCPAVVTVHDLGYLRYPRAHPPAARLYLDLSTRHSVRTASRIIAVSTATKEDLVARLRVPATKISVIPEACPTGFTPLADRAQGLAAAQRHGLDAPYVVSIGTMHPRKNLVRLVEAFAIARRQQGLPHRLAIVGRPGWRSAEVTKAIARYELADAVVLTGYVRESELPLVLGAADALVFPSLYEGFGLPALEAMACGVPVIAANASSLPEVVGDAGLLVDPLDVEAMAQAIGLLLCDRQLQAELAARGLQRSREYSWERSARETLAVLTAACSP